LTDFAVPSLWTREGSFYQLSAVILTHVDSASISITSGRRAAAGPAEIEIPARGIVVTTIIDAERGICTTFIGYGGRFTTSEIKLNMS